MIELLLEGGPGNACLVASEGSLGAASRVKHSARTRPYGAMKLSASVTAMELIRAREWVGTQSSRQALNPSHGELLFLGRGGDNDDLMVAFDFLQFPSSSRK